ncbi:phospholipase D family protein [Thalassotalea agarivorans]|uniref:Phosphatidylserine/phosphatidylglycerophosphate/cardiolipin synthase n=1 Tax=Thalassotalea agarivorans TaxID=349064 RepID=A0A1H9ZKH7_THASX|nr:phospholipase D family protein [Thalassotalea agarivorans]SES82167.1 Phosphatidylserine/phosphatidylglycerophosphate/cardiolipin synthase [Thalassotalea agarivorans]
MVINNATISLLKKLQASILLLLVTGCASLPSNDQQIESYAISPTQTSVLEERAEKGRKRDNQTQSSTGILPLAEGIDAFVARAALARLAQHSLDVQYYLFHSDLTGNLLTAEFWRAAERGVRVRILLDDMDMAGRDKTLAILNAHDNIEIRIFNPFIRGKSRAGQYITRFGSVTRRAHNKAFIADNQFAIVGGRNIGDEYFGANPNLAFGDLDVMVTQPSTGEVSSAFDLYWNSPLAYPVETLIKHQTSEEELASVETYIDTFYQENKDNKYIESLQQSKLLSASYQQGEDYFWGDTEVLYDLPDKISEDRENTAFHLAPKLGPYFLNAKDHLLVVSPYFVPGKSGVEFFQSLQEKGVKVSILTNSLMSNDVPIVHVGYARYREELIEAGVQLYELDPKALGLDFKRQKSGKNREGIKGSKSSLHAKYFVIDDQFTFIGSLNLDPRSVIENTEIGVVVDNEQLGSRLTQQFNAQIKHVAFKVTLEKGDLLWTRTYSDGSSKTFDQEPYSSWWDRLSIFFMSLLPVESQI